MEIQTKFNIGDTVYVIDNAPNYTTRVCPACNGEKEVELGGMSFKCPCCHGNGDVEYRKENYSLAKRKILRINCQCSENEHQISYAITDRTIFYESNIDKEDGFVFKSRKKASERLEILTKEDVERLEWH